MAYAINLDDFYVSDDFDHPYLAGLTWQKLRDHVLLPTAPGEFFRPLSLLSMGLDHALWGRHAPLSHLMNVLLHAVASLLVATVTQRMIRERAPAVLAGTLYALHPAHPEAVSFLGSRFDLLCAVLGLAALAAYQRSALTGSRRSLALSAALALGSILSKEAGLFLPLVFVVYELTCVTQKRWWRPLPALGLTAAYAAYRVWIIGETGGYSGALGSSRHVPTLSADTMTTVTSFAGYGLVTPVNQAVFDGRSTLIAAALVALFIPPLLAFAVRRLWWRPALFAWLFTALALLPAASLFDAHGLAARLEGSRYLYFPSAGFCIALALWCMQLRPRALRRGVVVAQLGVYFALTVAHALPWRRASTLARSSLQTILDECYPLAGDRPVVLIADAPDNVQGAHLWRNGLPNAVRNYHPQRPTVAFVRPFLPADFAEADGFDLRDYAGDAEACLLQWNVQRSRLENFSPWLERAAVPPPLAPGSANDWRHTWRVEDGVVESRQPIFTVATESDDLRMTSPPQPLAASVLEVEMAVEPASGPTSGMGELFWAVDDRPFSSDEHHRVFGVQGDGRVHTYRLALPLTRVDELAAGSLRVRLDPTTFPAKVTIRRLALVSSPGR